MVQLISKDLLKQIKAEGDLAIFTYQGYICVARRRVDWNLFDKEKEKYSCFHWCGYVGLPEGHPYYSKHYDDLEVNCHGGLTFAGDIGDVNDKSNLWFVGFDCAHAGDLCFEYGSNPANETYKPLTYVKQEIKSIVDQLVIKGMINDSLQRRNIK